MYLIQFKDLAGQVKVGVIESCLVYPLKTSEDLYALSMKAIVQRSKLTDIVNSLEKQPPVEYKDLLGSARILPPVPQIDPLHILISGTGLTHSNSVSMRKDMNQTGLSEAQKIYNEGLSDGKPNAGQPGAMPEWFFKGFGCQLRTSNQKLTIPEYVLDGGEEAELAVIYVVGNDAAPYRLGFTLGNEFSDHRLEKKNHYYLARSKLCECSIGTEIFVGDLPEKTCGTITIKRNTKEVWTKQYDTGADKIIYSLDNIERHFFKYNMFRIPGQVHIFFLGADKVSFKDGISLESGDEIIIDSDFFPNPLVNTVKQEAVPKDFSVFQL